ncbi:MAG TPA: hypothetical protein VE462_10255 [Propionibacteriaceae bacterium]|jgi:hypothetical protein|nr:hypothetical protein [Propionibacteriaceae bacterium]
MTKSLINKLFFGSLIGLVGGLILLAVAGGLAFANNVFVMNGPDVTGINASPLAWTLLSLMALGMLVIAAGAIAQFVAWIGAVLNTANLPDKGWFIVLLVVGLLGFPFIVTLIYVIAGPDGAPPGQLAGHPARAVGASTQQSVSTAPRR